MGNQVVMEEVTQQKEKISFWKKAEKFLDKHYAVIFAPLIVLALYIAMLSYLDVYPFGNRYTAASYDLSAQIAPFIEHLFDVFEGKSTLTYTYSLVGGADVTGTFLYFFISPFSFLFLVFGDGKVAHASSIVMAAKLTTIAFSGTWFSKKLFKGIPDYLCVVVGVIYAYCGYTFVANTYINWMDFLIYLPFAAWAFKRFVCTGKFLAFSILMACCIYTCFSIACFSMFIAFPTLIFYGLICVEKERRNKFIAYLCLSFVVALLISLPVLLPAFSATLNSARGGDLFENLWYGYSKTSSGELKEFLPKTFETRFSDSLYAKMSYILSDTVFVALTIAWFFKKGLKDPFAKFMLVAGVFTMLPVVVDEAMNLMNMGSYMSYALRFGFLNALYFLGGACLALEGICFKGAHSYDGERLMTFKGVFNRLAPEEKIFEKDQGMDEMKTELPARKKDTNTIKIISVAFLAIGVAIAVFLFYYWYEYDTFLPLFTQDSEVLKSIKNFSGAFAHSLGGLEVLLVFVLAVGALTAAGCILVSMKKISPRLLSYVLILAVGVQVLFYNNQIVAGNLSTQHVNLGTYERLCSVLNEQDDSYFRVKDYNDKLTAPAPLTGGTNSFSVFSSVIDADNFVTQELFGYLGNNKNMYKSGHNKSKSNRSDEFGDSFLGYKYFFVPEAKKTEVESGSHAKYLEPYMLCKSCGGSVTRKDDYYVCNLSRERVDVEHLSEGGFYIYENKIVFPIAYKVDSGEFRFEKPNTNNSTNRAANQRALYKFLRGEELEDMKEITGSSSRLYVTPETARELSEYLKGRAAEQVKVEAGKITVQVTAEKGECLFLNFVASKGYTVTVNGEKVKLIDNDLKFLSVELEKGANTVVFEYSSPYVKQMGVGCIVAVVGLVAVWFVVKKTKIMQVASGVVSWAGVLLALGVIAFFMVYPTCVFMVKVFKFFFT